jgi:threonyl-tRNA synthetase
MKRLKKGVSTLPFGGYVYAIVAVASAYMALRPMSCACHVQVFNKDLRSWRELLVHYAEFGACSRNEPSVPCMV